MHSVSRYLLAILLCGGAFLRVGAQCPNRPGLGTVVLDAYTVNSENGVLNADFALGQSVDAEGYTHYCFNYKAPSGYVESPTLRLNPGDTLKLGVKDIIKTDNMPAMKMDRPPSVCGDSGPMTVSSTNVHFHGMIVSPTCHQDDVINTLIQPGSPGFQFNIPVPAFQPPGLYWYHPHVHRFTEFQVNGGAAGALIVNGMEKVRPEVTGLTERVFVIRQQYLVPWIPGPYQLSLNLQVAAFPNSPSPIIQMKPGEKQFWRVANATIQDFLQLQFVVNSAPQSVELIALDGYPLTKPRAENTILIPPAGRAEFIVEAPASGRQAQFLTQSYSTGPTGNPDLEQILAQIQLTDSPAKDNPPTKMPPAPASTTPPPIKFSNLSTATVTANRKLYFSEEFGGTNGPIQFYITVDGQKQQVFSPTEKPAIVTRVGAVE